MVFLKLIGEQNKANALKILKILKILIILGILVQTLSCGKHCLGEFGLCGVEDEPEYSSSSNETTQQAVVGPLLQTQWSQVTPYNDLFPVVGENYNGYITTDNNRRLLTDCGNTAISQIMKFHNYPARGSGSQSTLIQTHNITVPAVTFNVAYDWDNMLNTYTTANPGTEQQRNAVATLMYHVAAANGSTTVYYPGNYILTMTDVFGYDKSIKLHYRRFYSDAEWEALIRQQLDLGLPVYYHGHDPEGPHAFVVDGYDNIGRFHINMGGAGSYNRWYSLNNINLYGTKRFYNDQHIIINIKPNAGGAPADYELGLVTFTANKTSVSHDESITVSFRPSSLGFFPGGQFGAALTDNNDNIVKVIGIMNYSWPLNPGIGYTLSHDPLAINGFVPETVNAGQYKLRIVSRTENRDWKIITLADKENNTSSSIPFTVTAGEANGDGYGMALTTFTANNTTVSRNVWFDVGYRLANVGQETFEGQVGAALVDNNNNIVSVLRSWNSGKYLVGYIYNASNSNIISVSCTISNSVEPGQYKLRMVARPSENAEWKIITFSLEDSPISIDFEVK